MEKMKAILFEVILVMCWKFSASDYYIDNTVDDYFLDFDDFNRFERKPKPEIDPERIMRNKIPLYLDVALLVDLHALNKIYTLGLREDAFLASVIGNVTEIFGWHNIKFAVRHLDYPSQKYLFKKKISRNIKEFKKNIPVSQGPYDAIIVLINERKLRTRGFSIFGSLCSDNSTAFINLAKIKSKNPRIMASTIAHEVGHLLGFHHHKKYEKCNCGHVNQRYCMMNSEDAAWKKNFAPTFYDCHIFKLMNTYERFECLLHPMKQKRVWNVCGDSFKGEDEQCDCGNSILCSEVTQEDMCCNRETCRFKNPSFQCVKGKCCEGCMITRGNVCRPAQQDCDVEEICDGVSNFCPKDVFKNNGTSCNKGSGTCKRGICFRLSFTKIPDN